MTNPNVPVANTLFLQKVYDKYYSIDFNIGQADLNPIREIHFFDSLDEDQLIKNLRKKLQDQLNKMRAGLQMEGFIPLEEKDPNDGLDATFNTAGSESRPKGDTLKDIINKVKTSSIGDSLLGLDLGLDGLMPDPMLKEIDDLIMKLLPPLFVKLPEEGEYPPFPEPYPPLNAYDPYLPGKVPLSPLCSGLGPDMLKDAASDAFGLGDGAGGDLSGLGEADANALEEAIKKEADAKAFMDALQDKANQEKQDLMQCTMSSLALLKIILIILMIIKVYKLIMTYIIGIIVPIAELVMLAAGIWINPTNIAKIIAYLSEKAFAILASIISEILAKLLAMLNLDCLVGVEDSLDQINNLMLLGNKAIYDIGNAFSMSGDTGKFMAKIKELYEKTLKEITSKYNESKKEWAKVREDPASYAKKIGSSIVENYKEAQDAVIDDALDQVDEAFKITALHNKAMDIYESGREMVNTSTQAFKNIQDLIMTIAKPGANDMVKKLNKLYEAEDFEGQPRPLSDQS
jgi:hypothetical protein